MLKLLLPFVLLLGLFACHKNDCSPTSASQGDQIIFGVSYAECAGDCSRNFRLTTDQLFADDCEYCYFDQITFQALPLPVEKFEIAEALLGTVPTALIHTPDTVYGCPGCADEGGYYLEIIRNGDKHIFRWSAFYDEVPDKFRPYFEQVAQVLQDL